MTRDRPPLLLPALGLSVLIASGTFLVAKETLKEFPPLALSQLRFILAAALMWPVARALQPKQVIRREDRPRLILLGLLGVPLNQGLFLFGMQWASASHAALLYALTPAFVVLFAAAGGTRPTLGQLAGVVLAFAGVATLLVQRGLHFDAHSVRGDLLILAAVMSWSLYIALGRDVTRRYGPLAVTSEALLAGALLFLPIGIPALLRFHPAEIHIGGWVGLFYLAWLTSALHYMVIYWGLGYLKAASVAMLTNLQPIVATVMAVVILHERVPAGFALSCALVLAGVWLTQYGRPTPRPPTT